MRHSSKLDFGSFENQRRHGSTNTKVIILSIKTNTYDTYPSQAHPHSASLLPDLNRLLADLGDNIRLARLRRRLTAIQVAERSGMSLPTLRAAERGQSGVTIGAYAAVLRVLGLAACRT